MENNELEALLQNPESRDRIIAQIGEGDQGEQIEKLLQILKEVYSQHDENERQNIDQSQQTKNPELESHLVNLLNENKDLEHQRQQIDGEVNSNESSEKRNLEASSNQREFQNQTQQDAGRQISHPVQIATPDRSGHEEYAVPAVTSQPRVSLDTPAQNLQVGLAF